MMRPLRLGFAVLALLTTALASAGDEPFTLDQILHRHLASIGTPEARAVIHARIVEGTSRFEVLNGSGWMDGKSVIASAGDKYRLLMKYDQPDYPGEDMRSDGSKIQVYGRPKRSALGSFVYNESSLVLSEGLLGGTLSTAWPLLDPALNSATLTYNGLKDINGERLHEIRYTPRQRTDVEIRLYFTRNTCRHVLTVATLTVSPPLLQTGQFLQFPDTPQRPIYVPGPEGAVGADAANSEQQVIRHRLEERFSNFVTVDGLTLPRRVEIRYDVEGMNQAHVLYVNTVNRLAHNPPIDDRSFAIQ